jgi:hypothetical protein
LLNLTKQERGLARAGSFKSLPLLNKYNSQRQLPHVNNVGYYLKT